jgi:hypothetical protein
LALLLVVLSKDSLSSMERFSTLPLSGFRLPSLVESRGKVEPAGKPNNVNFLLSFLGFNNLFFNYEHVQKYGSEAQKHQ